MAVAVGVEVAVVVGVEVGLAKNVGKFEHPPKAIRNKVIMMLKTGVTLRGFFMDSLLLLKLIRVYYCSILTGGCLCSKQIFPRNPRVKGTGPISKEWELDERTYVLYNHC